MRIALITPHYRSNVGGNAVTVHRIEYHLLQLGCVVDVFDLDSVPADTAVNRITAGKYDLCHAFHACKGGAVAHEAAETAGIPYVVTITGSDINEALVDDRRNKTVEILAGAAQIVAFHDSIAKRLASGIPLISDKITVIPQGVQPPYKQLPKASAKPAGAEFIFLLPAGLRPIKRILFCVEPLARLVLQEPNLRLVIVGPVLDNVYASKVLARLRQYPFADYSGAVDHAEMGRLYSKADVVLNSSFSEGGMANSLLEAMAWGKPVLASDIEGNRSLVNDGVTGLLFRDAEDFYAKAKKILADSSLRQKLSDAAFQMILGNHDPKHEAAQYLELYGRIKSGQKHPR